MRISHSLVRRFQAAFLAISLGAVALVHSPWLPTPTQGIGHAVSNFLGQEVRWSMFSHDPRGFWTSARAEIDHFGRTTTMWTLDPREGGHSYRQLKWLESAAFEPEAGFRLLGRWLGSNPDVSRVRIWIDRHPVPAPGDAAPSAVTELVYDSDGASS